MDHEESAARSSGEYGRSAVVVVADENITISSWWGDAPSCRDVLSSCFALACNMPRLLPVISRRPHPGRLLGLKPPLTAAMATAPPQCQRARFLMRTGAASAGFPSATAIVVARSLQATQDRGFTRLHAPRHEDAARRQAAEDATQVSAALRARSLDLHTPSSMRSARLIA